MKRREFLKKTTQSMLGLSVMQHLPAVAQGEKKPNVLFCIADDASYPHMGAYGCDWVNSPAFDRVANEGILFTRAYTPNAKCAPSRSCILTGRNSWQLESAANHWPLFPQKFKTYHEALADHGYHVGFTGKGWAPGRAYDEDGNDRQLLGKGYHQHKLNPPTQAISRIDYAANFEQFLDEKSADEPFCFWYGGSEPHRAYEYGSGLKNTDKSLDDVDHVPEFWPDNETVRTDMLDYAYEIEHFDNHLEKMLALLEERGELDNTIVVVTADNGMPFPRIKGQNYEYSNHMPFAIMWKNGIQHRNRVVDDYVSFIDLAPTFLEIAGVSEPQSGMKPITGKSLTNILASSKSGKVEPERDYVLIGKERHDVGRPQNQGYPVRGIFKQNYLYLYNFEPSRWPAGDPYTGYLNTDGSPTKTIAIDARQQPGMRKYWYWNLGKRPIEELYDISQDPGCLNNLAHKPEHQTLKKDLQDELFTKLTQQKDPRLLGNGDIFEQYEYADDNWRGFYESKQNGDERVPGWVNVSDFDGMID